jgi:hypothetical protein
MRCAVTVLFLVVLPAIGQKNPRGAIKAVDEYCIAISRKVDEMDDLEEDTLLSDLQEPGL